MWRVLIYLAIIAALAAGAVWLAEQPGSVAFVWDGVSYSVGLAVAALALLVVIAAILLVEAGARIVLNLPQRLSGAARERKKRKAIQALSRGMIAVGSGDENAARRHARDAERYLRNDEPLLLLLKAQAAQIAGDRDKAEAVFQEMAQVQETRVLGLRGLYVEARRRGDADAAWKHASEAARLAPAVDWANEAVLEGLCARGDWRAAIDTVERRAALGLVEKATAKRQRAVLLTADALAKAESDEEAALASAKEAVRLAPDLVPAAVLAGRILGRHLELRKAGKILEAAWQATPHPDLADAYTHLRAGDSALDRMKRAERLAMLSSWAPEGRIALVKAAIEAREFETARKTLDPLLQEGRPTVRICLLMAELARVEAGSSAGAREWLARAVHAPRDKAWIADGVVSDRWSPISPVSGHLDAFRWETPPELISGAGSSVIDDVVGDLDDRARTPTGILGAPVTERSDTEAASDAEIIPPERERSAPEKPDDDASGEQDVTRKADSPGKPQAAPAEKVVAADPRDSIEAPSKPPPGTHASAEPTVSAPASAKPAPEGDGPPEPIVSDEPRVSDEPADSAKSESVRAQDALEDEAPAQTVKAEAAPSAPTPPGAGEAGSTETAGIPVSPGAEGHRDGPAESGEANPDAQVPGKRESESRAPDSPTTAREKSQGATANGEAKAALSEEERLERLSRPPDDPGVSPEEAEEVRKRKQSFFGGLFGR
ncbi:MAG: heme biosynthesis HemY N-terminal domain-containing protein [Salinarimonas sp.]